jgi:hypothetical protein
MLGLVLVVGRATGQIATLGADHANAAERRRGLFVSELTLKRVTEHLSD